MKYNGMAVYQHHIEDTILQSPIHRASLNCIHHCSDYACRLIEMLTDQVVQVDKLRRDEQRGEVRWQRTFLLALQWFPTSQLGKPQSHS